MTWAPKNQVFDDSLIIDNILGFIGDNDDEVLAWVSPEESLPEFRGLYPTATGRLATLFPQVLVLDQELQVPAKENEGDLLVGHLALTFEGAVTGASADATSVKAKLYAVALVSMLVNLRADDLTEGLDVNIVDVVPLGYQTAHDQIKGQGGKNASSWLQIWQTRIEYRLYGEA